MVEATKINIDDNDGSKYPPSHRRQPQKQPPKKTIEIRKNKVYTPTTCLTCHVNSKPFIRTKIKPCLFISEITVFGSSKKMAFSSAASTLSCDSVSRLLTKISSSNSSSPFSSQTYTTSISFPKSSSPLFSNHRKPFLSIKSSASSVQGKKIFYV